MKKFVAYFASIAAVNGIIQCGQMLTTCAHVFEGGCLQVRQSLHGRQFQFISALLSMAKLFQESKAIYKETK